MSNVFEFKRKTPATTKLETPTATLKVPNLSGEKMASQWHAIVMGVLQTEVTKACTMPEVYDTQVKHAINFGEGMPEFGRLNIWAHTDKTVEELNGKVPPFLRLEVQSVPEALTFNSDRTDICGRKLVSYQNAWLDANPAKQIAPHCVMPSILWQLLISQPFDLLVANYRMPLSPRPGDVPVIVFHDMEQFLEYRMSFDMQHLKENQA